MEAEQQHQQQQQQTPPPPKQQQQLQQPQQQSPPQSPPQSPQSSEDGSDLVTRVRRIVDSTGRKRRIYSTIHKDPKQSTRRFRANDRERRRMNSLNGALQALRGSLFLGSLIFSSGNPLEAFFKMMSYLTNFIKIRPYVKKKEEENKGS